LLKPPLPVKTDRGDGQRPGFTEIDWVSPSGGWERGEFCPSLHLTDMHTPWTEARAVLGQGQEGVRWAREEMRQALPFPLSGSDSDNRSEFIQDPLDRYCQAQEIPFTRGRPYKKEDHAPLEPKNWTPVRRWRGSRR
jgi:hypothetical protein